MTDNLRPDREDLVSALKDLDSKITIHKAVLSLDPHETVKKKYEQRIKVLQHLRYLVVKELDENFPPIVKPASGKHWTIYSRGGVCLAVASTEEDAQFMAQVSTGHSWKDLKAKGCVCEQVVLGKLDQDTDKVKAPVTRPVQAESIVPKTPVLNNSWLPSWGSELNMKHNWEALSNTMVKTLQYGWNPVRKCKNCGAIQTKESNTLWMRVVGYSWQPLVGRCKGKDNYEE